MIPDRVVEVPHGPAFMQAGTRDADLRPAHTVAVGALVHDDRRTVTFSRPLPTFNVLRRKPPT